jgi:hypothetical protein
MEGSSPPDPARYEALVAAKDRLVLLALQDAERYYRTRGDVDSEDSADNIIDEAFDQAVLDYVREMAALATDNLTDKEDEEDEIQ